MALPPVMSSMLLVFGLISLTLILFVTELVPSDITAIGILVLSVVFEPWTSVAAQEAISGFAGPATITIGAMYILSEAIQEMGLGVYLAGLTKPVKQSSRWDCRVHRAHCGHNQQHARRRRRHGSAHRG